MMYDELIKKLRRCEQFRCRGCEYENVMGCRTKLNAEAADAIEELQQITTHYEEESKGWWLAACDAKEERERLKEQIPKWIPVTERLPEKDQTVLAYCAEDNFCYISRMHQSFEDYDVTHWIPLPQMPESEGKR